MDAPVISSPMIDIGVNLTDKSFASDRDQVIERAKAANVRHMVLTGTSEHGSQAAAELADAHRGLMSATAGVHPHDASSYTAETRKALVSLAQRDVVVAIGECGLDFNRDFSPRPAQRDAFRSQLELACELAMPVFVHERDAGEDLVEIIDSFGDDLGPLVVHCFTGTGDTLAEYLERDFYVGITGWICDERRGHHLHELVGTIAEDRLMIETDAPYLLPRTIRPRPKSRRNEPSFLPYVVATIAEATGETPDAVAERTSKTARAFFRLTS